MTHLCITVRWLDDRYHGLLARDGPPEWPPSPFRLFQALLSGVARRGELGSRAGKSLDWLQSLEPPIIIAPRSRPGQVVTRFVPNNDGNKVPDRQNRLTGKTSRPTLMLDRPEIRYLWPVPEDCPQAHEAAQAARYLTCLGWGSDMAYADGELVDDGQLGNFNGVRWIPRPEALDDAGLLRVPVEGTMADLLRAHKSALNRIEHGNKPLRAVDRPQVFDHVFYASAEHPTGRPCVVFALRTTDDEYYRYPHAKLVHIAGMTRSAAIKVMDAYAPEDLKIEDVAAWVESFVAGHRPEGAAVHKQFSYIPLPSIGHEHSDAMIRRVMIAAPFGHESQLRHLADQLDGKQLQPEGGGEGPTLERLPTDGVTRRYLALSRIGASVTPVILPGHDDHKAAKTVKLIQLALLQSGIGEGCGFTWGAIPNFNACLTAHKYDREGRRAGCYRPAHLESLTAVHVRLTFQQPVAGPVVIGAGRHCGLGVLAGLSEPSSS
jgi:CRISPR-associated protein Csb2